MPKVKTTAQKGKFAASYSRQREIEEDNAILDEIVEEEEMMENPDEPVESVGRRKKRTSEEVRRDRQKHWMDTMGKRTVKNKRHIDVASIGENHRSIRRIAKVGLSY